MPESNPDEILKGNWEQLITLRLFAGQTSEFDGYDLPILSIEDQEKLNQALIHFAEGDFISAAQGLQNAYDHGATGGNVLLLLYVAQRRGMIKPEIDMSAMIGQMSNSFGGVSDASYLMLIRTLKGGMSAQVAMDRFRKEWGDPNDTYAIRSFFLGEAALINGDKEEAIKFFKKAAAAAKLNQIESKLAAAELARLQP